MKNLKNNLLEYYTLVLITIGLPAVALAYFDLRAALFVFVVVQTGLGLFLLRGSR